MKAQLKNHLSLTKKEWNGIVVLLVLIALVLIAPYVYQWLHKDSTINVTAFNKVIASLKTNNPIKSGGEAQSNALFKFNPNKLYADEWQKLGVTAKQAAIILNYVAKGGHFRKTEDLKKIYGFTGEDYKRLAPYITIPKEKGVVAKVVELNSSDSSALTSVDGIGPAFAKRIIFYRERLGGFITKEQLREVYGIDELKYNEIKDQLSVDARHIRKIGINTVTFDKLRLMPYLNYKQVNAIIEYRKQHGNYTSIADIKNIAIIDDDILRKIEPYLSFK